MTNITLVILPTLLFVYGVIVGYMIAKAKYNKNE